MFVNIVEFFFSIGLFVNAILFIPQIIKLLKIKCSDEFSLITFIGFSLINLFMLLHGVIKEDWLLAIGSSFTLITSTSLTVLIIWYRILFRKINNKAI